MKIAIYYDWLIQWGGAERLLLDILKIYPRSDLFTLFYHPRTTTWLPPNISVTTSFLQNFPQALENLPIYSPLYPLAASSLNFDRHHLIISLSGYVGHWLKTPPNSSYVCYYLNPNRYLYQSRRLSNRVLKYLFLPLDRIASRRPQHHLCISQTVQARLAKTYHLKAQVIYPGVDTQLFTPVSQPRADYLLLVSRLVPHKNIDLAILACRYLHLPLKIVGTGRSLSSLRSLCTGSIQLLGQVDHPSLLRLYQNCQALICPQPEDFGLTPLEAMACGRPVIALNSGGITETVVNGQTGLLFPKASVSSLLSALKRFRKQRFSPANCRRQALNFSTKTFMLNFDNFIRQKCLSKTTT